MSRFRRSKRARLSIRVVAAFCNSEQTAPIPVACGLRRVFRNTGQSGSSLWSRSAPPPRSAAQAPPTTVAQMDGFHTSHKSPRSFCRLGPTKSSQQAIVKTMATQHTPNGFLPGAIYHTVFLDLYRPESPHHPPVIGAELVGAKKRSAKRTKNGVGDGVRLRYDQPPQSSIF